MRGGGAYLPRRLFVSALQRDLPMRAEIQSAVADIQQALSLLRRHL
jgi:Tfp pilus assembly protein PilO